MEKRLKVIGSFFLICALVLVAAQARICFFKGDEYSRSVASQRTQSLEVKSYRGKFYDRNMIPLVEYSTGSFYIDEDGTLTKERGVKLPDMTVRYGKDRTASHLIGYVNSDGEGVSGLEKVFDSVITAKEALKINVIKSADGKVLHKMGMSASDKPHTADSIKLTLDSHIQRICEQALRDESVTGAAVVLDVRSFDVLAMASMPDYDQSKVADYVEEEGSELVNRCLSQYNAGSIFKIITLSAALENNKLRYNYFCDGALETPGHVFGCHKYDGHGFLAPQDAFAASCNCAFYIMGADMGSETILGTARQFGLGTELVNLEGIEEMSGNIPSKNIYGYLESVNYAIGQGEILLTPLQAANMACIAANNGIRGTINIADAVCSDEGVIKQNLRQSGETRAISYSTALYLQDSMRKAVTEGTGASLADSPARIAGKTGTAETGWYENGQNLVHGWFCGYFPYDNPKYAMAVLVENGGSGALSAAPIFKNIAEEIIKIYPMG